MRLNQAQKEKVIELVVAGARTDEINKVGKDFNPPFNVSRQQIQKYRRTRKIEVKDMIEKKERSALKRGLALREKRVEKLQKLAERMGKDIFGKLLWTEDVKGVGSGPMCKIVKYKEFNAAEVAQYRGVLDDIAQEMGDRIKKVEHGGEDGGPIIIKVIYDK